MRGFQRLQIIGNLGKDPELRYTPSGVSVCTFPVAVNRKWNDSAGNAHEEVMWVRVSVWGPRSESCKNYLHKGQAVMAEGRLVVDKESGGARIYTTPDGKQRASIEMSAENVLFLGPYAATEGAESQPEASRATEDDEIPF